MAVKKNQKTLSKPASKNVKKFAPQPPSKIVKKSLVQSKPKIVKKSVPEPAVIKPSPKLEKSMKANPRIQTAEGWKRNYLKNLL